MNYRIVADENIPFVRQAFSTLGEVITIPGRAMTPRAAHDADVLAVRSITRVGPGLLEGSKVRFVGTATIGTDHIDLDYLASHDIAFSAAPGSNATSVAEYVVAALLGLAEVNNLKLAGKSIGVVGVGNVGSRVVKRTEALGMKVIQNDPPLKRQTGRDCFRPMGEVLKADVVTLHTPLTKEGPDPTWHLFDESMIRRMKPGGILINTSRGAVVDNPALLGCLEDGHISHAVLDVWEGEPQIDVQLLEKSALGTPHVAGYSFDGKAAGLTMIYRAACKALDVPFSWQAASALPPVENKIIDLTCMDTTEDSIQTLIHRAVEAAYPIRRDDRRLRETTGMDPGDRGSAFDRLRKEYPVRREFANYTIKTGRPELAHILEGIGFKRL